MTQISAAENAAAGSAAGENPATLPPAGRPVFAVFIAVSLDGFIARPDGGIDWLDEVNAALPPGEDCGYAAFAAGVDAVVMGRRTYEQVAAFPAWPFPDAPTTALSSKPLAVPARLAGLVRASSLPPDELAVELAAAGVRRAYVDGGETIRRFLAAGLIDELTVAVVPRLLGAGRPLFGDGPTNDTKLEHLGVVAYPGGLVQNRYRVRRDPPPAA